MRISECDRKREDIAVLAQLALESNQYRQLRRIASPHDRQRLCKALDSMPPPPQLLAGHSQCRDSAGNPHPPGDATFHNLIAVPPPLRAALSRHSIAKVRQETYVKPDPADLLGD
jgi:hypothetical protein